MVCNICRNIELYDPDATNEDNVILKCTKCNLKVHERCYGGNEKFRRKKSWLCNFCSSKDKEQSTIRKCQLCPEPNGALKATVCKQWVHLICALFNSSCEFVDEINLQPININKVSMKSFITTCSICAKFGKKIGATVLCAFDKCRIQMHVSRAQNKNRLREQINPQEGCQRQGTNAPEPIEGTHAQADEPHCIQ